MRRALLALYPHAWRRRYGDELLDVLGASPLTPGTVIDLVRGALDAHFHPELVEPALIASAGVATLELRAHPPHRRLLVAALLVLAALVTWGQSLPLPLLPIIVPIGAHASPEDYARSQVPELPLRLSAEREGIAAVLFADATEAALVTVYRTATLGWMGGGSSRLSGGPPSAPDPLRLGFATSWTSSAVLGGAPTHATIAIHGQSATAVARVAVHFADGGTTEALLADGAFLWLDVRRDAASAAPGQSLGAWIASTFGRVPSAVIAYGADGAELARQIVRFGP